MDHNIGATVTYPPITPPTLPPINPIICNIDSNSFECIICGEGQGIGPVLSGALSIEWGGEKLYV